MRGLAFGIACLMLAGCAGLSQDRYALNGRDGQVFRADLRICQAEPWTAGQMASYLLVGLAVWPLMPGIEAAINQGNVRACMEARGWQMLLGLQSSEERQNWAPSTPER